MQGPSSRAVVIVGHAGRIRNSINLQIANLKNKKMKILDSFADDTASQEDVRLYIQDCNSRIANLEAQKKRVDIDTDKFYLTVVDVIDVIRSLPQIYADFPKNGKTRLLKEYADHIIINENGLSLSWKRPFSYIFNSVRTCPTMHACPDDLRTNLERWLAS